MKFGFRVPSLKKRIAARTSLKRFARHSLGLKAPRGLGIITNPKKTLYNKVYRKTTFGIEDIFKSGHSSNTTSSDSMKSNEQVAESLQPVSYSDPYSFSPRSFIALVHSSSGSNPDTWPITTIMLGVLLLAVNPILGVLSVGAGVYWLYSLKQKPSYQLQSNLLKAKSKLKTNDFTDALTLLESAYKLDQSNQEIAYMLGATYQAHGNYKDSIVHLSTYVNVSPNDLDARLMLAYSHYHFKDYKAVIKLLQAFPQEYEQYLLVILLLGDSFLSVDDTDSAIEVLRRGPTRKTNLDGYSIRLHYLLGVAYQKKGQKANAVRELKRVYSADVTYKDTGELLRQLGEETSEDAESAEAQ